MSIVQFFKDANGHLSSKRLGYLSTIPFILIGTVWICDKLINKGDSSLAVEIWNSFFIFSAVLGGFVSAESLLKLLSVLRGVNSKEIKNVPNDPKLDS